MADHQTIKKGVIVFLILSIFILGFLILQPIIISIIFGLLAAYIFVPIYRRIEKIVKSKNLAASILILALVLLVAVPLIYLLPTLIRQTFDTFVLLRNFDFTDLLTKFFSKDISASVAVHLNNLLSTIFSAVINWFTDLLINLPSLLLQIIVFLFTFFYAVRDNKELKIYASQISPFSKSTGEKFWKEFRGITNAVIFGQVFIGILQGLALGIGLYFLGIPKVLILTFATIIASIIPILGSWLIWFPLGIVLLALGNTFAGIFVLLYGAFFVSLLDHFLRPYILSRQSRLPIVLSVIGTIGGLYFFGLAGLVLGPLILAYILIILEFYQNGKLNELFEK